MSRGKLHVVQSPSVVADRERAKRDADRRAEKRGSYVGAPKISNSFRNNHPGINRFEIVLMAPPVKSKTSRLLANGKRLVVAHEVSFAERVSRFSLEDRAQRRSDNKTMKFLRLLTRGRNLHGRNGRSARKAFTAKHQ